MVRYTRLHSAAYNLGELDMKKQQLSVSVDAALVDTLRQQAAKEHLTFSAVLNRALWQSLRPATPAAPTAATPTATPTATPAATPAATPTAAPCAPYDEAWKKWKAVPEPKDDAEALALCKAAGMDMNYINETNARLAWALYMETGDM